MNNFNKNLTLNNLLFYSFYILLFSIIFIDPSFAGQDSLSDEVDSTLGELITKVGKVTALASFLIGVVMSAVKFNPLILGTSLGVSIASLYGGEIIVTMFAAIL